MSSQFDDAAAESEDAGDTHGARQFRAFADVCRILDS